MLAALPTDLGRCRDGRAAAAASTRVRTPSLRRIDETWWSTVRWDRTRRLGDLGVAEPLRDETHHLDFARRQACGVAAGRRPRATRDTARTVLAEPARDDRRSRSGLQLPVAGPNAARSDSSSPVSARARAASYGQPSSSQRSAAALQSPASSRACGARQSRPPPDQRLRPGGARPRARRRTAARAAPARGRMRGRSRRGPPRAGLRARPPRPEPPRPAPTARARRSLSRAPAPRPGPARPRGRRDAPGQARARCAQLCWEAWISTARSRSGGWCRQPRSTVPARARSGRDTRADTASRAGTRALPRARGQRRRSRARADTAAPGRTIEPGTCSPRRSDPSCRAAARAPLSACRSLIASTIAVKRLGHRDRDALRARGHVVPQLVGEDQRPRRPLERALLIVTVAAEAGDVSVRLGQLQTRPERLQDLDRGPAGLLSLLGLDQGTTRSTTRTRSNGLRRDGLPARGSRPRRPEQRRSPPPAGLSGNTRRPLSTKQLRALVRGEGIGEAESARVLGRSLAMSADLRRQAACQRAHSGGPPPGPRPPPRGGPLAPGRARQRQVSPSAASARRCRTRARSGARESSIVRRASSCRKPTPLGRRDEHARGEALLEGAQLAGHERFEKPQLGVRGRDRGRRPGARAHRRPSRALRASTASRTVAGISSPGAARTSLTKNGFPPVLR